MYNFLWGDNGLDLFFKSLKTSSNREFRRCLSSRMAEQSSVYKQSQQQRRRRLGSWWWERITWEAELNGGCSKADRQEWFWNREDGLKQDSTFLAWVIVWMKNRGGNTGMSGWKEHKYLVLDLMVLIILSLQTQSTVIIEPSELWPLFCLEFFLVVTERKRSFFHPIN